MRRKITLILAALLSLGLILPAWATPPTPENDTTILFTHDLHSHFLPMPEEGGGESGGYARLASALEEQRERYPNALTLDGGDFSIGSLIQTLYTTRGAELRTMGMLGYDATTIGNHEFDHRGRGFGEMLNAAAEGWQGALPAVVQANYRPAADDPDGEFILEAMESYGVTRNILLERGGITYGIFGLMGVDSDDCAPTSGFELEDMAQAAQEQVARLRGQGAEFIICLSHSGTEEGKGEDYELARAVEGIDVIVSGHTHTTLSEPIVVGDTYIVSAGPYCRNLGSLTLRWDKTGEKSLVEYRLIPIDESLPEDPEIRDLVEGWKEQVGQTYLSRYGLTYDQVLTHTEFDLSTPVSGVQMGNALGELVADAFLWATENLEADGPDIPTVTVTADGVLRAGLARGSITTSMAFDVLSMGVGSDGTSGFPLVGVYLTGRELRAAAEVDASVTPIMNAAQLYMAGVDYSFNVHRMFFDRVTGIRLHREAAGEMSPGHVLAESTFEDIHDDQLYRVVTGMYSAQMLGTVKDKSMGLLSLEPKMADGSPVTDFDACILRDGEGNEIKEWYALAAYLRSFGQEGIPERYRAPDGRKAVSWSWNPVELVWAPGWITLAALAVLLALTAGVGLLVRRLLSRSRRRKTR
ncbi:MAG: bifunctional metallophosphatase/5'-nucleotidase [Oscillospiraceae bacterium]|nr:bifunctional metallophosphatase/5'-nucleotidase [Oscillospiraceae bacterium]